MATLRLVRMRGAAIAYPLFRAAVVEGNLVRIILASP
jgi:hypothetical protein